MYFRWASNASFTGDVKDLKSQIVLSFIQLSLLY